MKDYDQFEDKISDAVMRLRDDPMKTAKLIEILIDGAAFTIAVNAYLDSKKMDELLEGMSNYLYDSACKYANALQGIGERE